MLELKETYVECTPDKFESAVELCERTFGGFSHFTIRNGKAKYHMVTLPDRSYGIYYALRVTTGGLEGRRAMEPPTILKVCPPSMKRLSVKSITPNQPPDYKDAEKLAEQSMNIIKSQGFDIIDEYEFLTRLEKVIYEGIDKRDEEDKAYDMKH